MGAGFGTRWGMRPRWGGWNDGEAEAVFGDTNWMVQSALSDVKR